MAKILFFICTEEFTRLKEEIPDSLIDAHLKKKKKETGSEETAKDGGEGKDGETGQKKGIVTRLSRGL